MNTPTGTSSHRTARHDNGSLIDFAHTTGDQRAIVIGAGMGGLFAARALADHFEHVLVLDRDTLPSIPAQRKNVPQGQHVHALLTRGRGIIEKLLPGIGDELLAQGALVADFRRDMTWFQNGGYFRDPADHLSALMQSRPLLEVNVRRRTEALPNVAIVAGCQVTGLLASRDRDAVTGVRVTMAQEPATGIELRAALTIDASGRGSRLPAWLEQLGHDAPELVSAGVESRYATRLFRRVSGRDTARLVSIVVASPHRRRGGVMIAQEDDRWIVSLTSRGGTQPPTELAGFIDYAQSLEAPDIYHVVRNAEPLDDGAIYRFPRSQRRHYEQMDRFPTGLLPFGDALCSFNPVYAQGMTIAAIEAEQLGHCLASGSTDLASRFFAGIAAPLDSAWKLAAGGDLRYMDSPVELPRAARFITWYMAKLLVAAQRDSVVAGAYHRVANLVDMPPRLFRPNVALRVAKANLRHTGSPAHRSSPVEAASTHTA